MKIESTDKEVRTILQSGYYRIPRFQRPYSWEKDHIDDFWTDIIIESEDDYFIGSMVVYKQEKGYFGIVDGQQRMTTLTILLSVLRNKMNDLGYTDLAKGVHALIERPNIEHQSEYILQTETSFPYLQDHIQKFGDPELSIIPLEEEKTLQNAFKQIETLIGKTVDAITIDTAIKQEDKQDLIATKLKDIRDRLLNLKVIFIELDDEDDAYLIFETLNTRGKDLNTSDLIKNHITKLMKAKNANVDIPKEKWATVRRLIEESNSDIEIDPFLHHFWLSKFNFVTQRKLFKEVKRIVKKDNAKGFLDDLIRDAQTYRAIHEPDYWDWKKDEIRFVRVLESLDLFRVKLQTPTVLSVLRDYFEGNIKRNSALRILEAISKFHFIFTAITSQRSSGGISHMYASYARRLFQATGAQDKNDILNSLKLKLKDKIPSYSEFEVNFSQILYTKTLSKQKRLVQYILSCIHRASEIGTPIDYSQMTIEHIYPEKPDSAPLLDDKIVGQIGNLLLLDQTLNEKLANRPFPDKKRILMENKIDLDEVIEKSKDWGEEQIKERTNWLSSNSYHKVWNI